MSAWLPDHDHSRTEPDGRRSTAPARARVPLSMWIILGLAVAGIVVYLALDHWPHVIAALPYLGIVAVVGMHMFGHGGHGSGGHARGGLQGTHAEPPPRTRESSSRDTGNADQGTR